MNKLFPTVITVAINMLHKLLRFLRLKPKSLCHTSPEPALSTSAPPPQAGAVKIIHMGGFVEYYYMAVPARGIMEKYPSFLLARPEVFRRPWESVVRPEEILKPGEKFYVVPLRTVRKLRRQLRRPPIGEVSQSYTPGQSSDDFSIGQAPKCDSDISSGVSDNSHSKGFYVGKSIRHGSDARSTSRIEATSSSTPSEDLLSIKGAASAPAHPPPPRQRKARKMVMWQPTLTVIGEKPSPHTKKATTRIDSD